KRRKARFDKIAPAIETLKTDPEDPDANLAVGRFRCLNQDDWNRGLPLLARGSDTMLRAAAIGDLNNPTAAEDRAKVGDAWWDAAQAARSEQQRAYLMRANHWYKQADVELVGLKKLRVTQRLKDFEALAVEEIKRQEKAALDEMLRRSKPRRGMVGMVTVDGKDSGLILTYQLGKRFSPEKLAAALARYDKQGSAVSVEFLGVYQLETTSSLYVWLENGRPTRGAATLLFMPGLRTPMSSGRYVTLTLKAGLLAFRWVMPRGGFSNGQLNIQQLKNGVKGDQIEIVFTSKMLKTLKARRAKALIDVSGI
ncbi:MAG: hypothetical protein IIA67_03360, partial [Planctomycetes bacterium]|nr:hypothetical protein [Planctomycetota bacterium]